MTKKEILVTWLNEPKAKYSSKSNFHLGYNDGWDWVRGILRATITKNATFLKALDFSIGEIERFLKSKSGKRKLSEEECTVYFVGYRDGVQDAVNVIKKRFEKLN